MNTKIPAAILVAALCSHSFALPAHEITPIISQLLLFDDPRNNNCVKRTEGANCSTNFSVQLAQIGTAQAGMSNGQFTVELSEVVVTGHAQSQTFFATFGSISMPDTDGDGFRDFMDNCSNVANEQMDTDADGFGNRCDTDFNGDGVTNAVDLGLLRQNFFTNEMAYDLNGDGVVNFQDLGILRTFFFSAPGPTGIPE